MRAVIVDKQGNKAAAMTESGEVISIDNRGYEIGQSIEIDSKKRKSRNVSFYKKIKKASSLVAAVVIVAMAGSATAYALPYGTVSLDSDPEIEYTINCFNYVLDVNALNEDAETVLENMDLSELRNKNISSAVKITIDEIEKSACDGEEVKITIDAQTKSEAHTNNLKKNLESSIMEGRDTKEQETEPDNYKNELPLDEQETVNEGKIETVPDQFDPGASEKPEEEPGAGIGEPDDKLENGGPENNGPDNNGPENNEGGGVPFLIHE